MDEHKVLRFDLEKPLSPEDFAKWIRKQLKWFNAKQHNMEIRVAAVNTKGTKLEYDVTVFQRGNRDARFPHVVAVWQGEPSLGVVKLALFNDWNKDASRYRFRGGWAKKLLERFPDELSRQEKEHCKRLIQDEVRT